MMGAMTTGAKERGSPRPAPGPGAGPDAGATGAVPAARGPLGATTLTGRPQLMRALNERLLLEHLRSTGRASRAELARTSGLAKPTVALALANLEQDGLVQVAGLRTGMRGPAAALYTIRSEAGHVLGLDVGREYLRGAVADLSGNVLTRLSRQASSVSAHERVDELVSLAEELAGDAGITRGRLTQVVIGSPGVYDPDRGGLFMVPNFPGWEGRKVVTELRRRLGPSTAVENDIDMFALAERDLGHGRDLRDFCVVSVGTGIGMGLVVRGQLHRGMHGAAGEIGYLPVPAAEVTPADARRYGMLEAGASAAAVVKAARRAGMGGPLSARKVFAAAATDDPRAVPVLHREVSLIARAVCSVVAVVDPELVVLGGGIGQAPGFADAVAEELRRLLPFVPEVKVSELGSDAVVDGCLALGLERAWQYLLERS